MLSHLCKTVSIVAATLSLSGAGLAAQDITKHLEDLGSHSAIKKRGISDFHFWRGDLWVFSAAESSNTPILRFTPGPDTWRKDQDKNLDAEKKFARYGCIKAI